MLVYKYIKPVKAGEWSSPFQTYLWRIGEAAPFVSYLCPGSAGYHYQPAVSELIDAPWYTAPRQVFKEYCRDKLVIGEFEVNGGTSDGGFHTSIKCAQSLTLLRILPKLDSAKQAAITKLFADVRDGCGMADKLNEITAVLGKQRTRCAFRKGDRVYFTPEPKRVGTVVHVFRNADTATGREFFVAVALNKYVTELIDGKTYSGSPDGVVLFSDKKLTKVKESK